MRILKFFMIVICGLLSCGLLQAQTQTRHILPQVSITYTVTLNSSRLGKATLGKLISTLTETDDGAYLASSVTRTQGLAALLLGSNYQERCQFNIKHNRIIPTSYSGGRKNRQDYSAHFDWKNRKIKFNSGEILDQPAGYVIDNCSMPYAAALLDKQLKLSEMFYVVDGRNKRLLTYVLKSSEMVMLDTAFGRIQTTKVALQREFNANKTFTIWLSQAHDNLPVKMEEKRKSRTTTMVASSIEL